MSPTAAGPWAARRSLTLALALLLLAAAGATPAPGPLETPAAFIVRAEQELTLADAANQRAQWVNQTNLNEDTNWLAARASERFTAVQMNLARTAATYRSRDIDPIIARKLALLAVAVRSPAPPSSDQAGQWADLRTRLVARYNQQRVVDGERMLGSYGEVRHAMETTRDPEALLHLWHEWHAVGHDLEDDYARYVALSRQGAQSLGFHDVGELWRSVYDMSPTEMAADTERLWAEIRPLYAALHCHTRAALSKAYGAGVQAPAGPIRIELTRNPMGMYWVGAYDLLATGLPTPGYDLDHLLESHPSSGEALAHYADRFWTSTGLPAMPASFWTRSLFDKPSDRTVACSGSAAIVGDPTDVRLKMCVGNNALDFSTVHHEVGHAVYALAYQEQPYLFRGAANDAFHEAVADLGALSITPAYLQAIGIITPAEALGADQDLGLLLRMALQRVTFLPFSLIVDRWRWQVYAGAVPPAQYDATWWSLVAQYQGLMPGETRPEGSFDIAALPHITSDISYIRYFYAYLIEFQLFKAACDAAGWTGPLHRCSLYGNAAAGAHLRPMLAMGASRPGADALEAGTGARRVSAEGLLAYFAPLRAYLDAQNQERQCGW